MKRVLLVEDEKSFRDLVKHVLGMDGFHVRTASNGLEALEHVRRSRFDLVITDTIMPGMEGIEMILELRSISPDTKVIAMSGGQTHSSGDFLPLARTLGACAVLKKPFDRATLIRTIREQLFPEPFGFHKAV